jgi:benzoate/toluate 1,2-dioxygenase reductase subunit
MYDRQSVLAKPLATRGPMGFKIALNFEDGVTRFIDGTKGESVADAAYRQGINIPLDCRDGACGTCKSFCEAGEYDGGFYIEDALTEEEAAEGYCLPCQMRPRTDCVLRIPASSALCNTRASDLTAEVIAVDRLSQSTIDLSVKLAHSEFSFLPGQYLNIAVPGMPATRAYSFSSPPGMAVASFLIRVLPGGNMSGYLTGDARPGDQLLLKGPFGSFYLRDLTRPVVMLAGGTGLAPFLSMLGRLAETGSSQPVHLIYGVTIDEDLVKVPALEEFAATIPNFTFTTCVADAGSRHERRGYVTHYLTPAHLNAGDVDVYLCGPPAMVDAVRVHFRENKVTPRNFHYEKFVPSAEGAAS